MIYVITGHLGSGKTLLAVSLAQEYLLSGRRVASNITLNPEYLVKADSRCSPMKLPYIPTADHLNALGKGYDGPYDESKFGLIILDEAGSWLNSHDWKDKGRRALFTWVTHARKYCWDVGLLVQDYEALDAQIRRSVTELLVSCARTDRVKLPYLPLKLPRMHVATARYKSATGPIYKRWVARGTDLFRAYDTQEAVRSEELYCDDGPVDMRATYSLLSAWHLRGRYQPPRRPFRQVVSELCCVAWICFLTFLLSAAIGRSPRAAVGRIVKRYSADTRKSSVAVPAWAAAMPATGRAMPC